MDVRERRVAQGVTAAAVAAVLVPGVLPAFGAGGDDFPLSTYPMFTAQRHRTVAIATVVAVDGGVLDRLSPEEIAGTDQVMLAVTSVQRAVQGHGGGPDRLCAEVAGRVRGERRGRLEVVVETHDAIAWSAGEREPTKRRVVATCAIAG